MACRELKVRKCRRYNVCNLKVYKSDTKSDSFLVWSMLKPQIFQQEWKASST